MLRVLTEVFFIHINLVLMKFISKKILLSSVTTEYFYEQHQ